MTEFSNPIYSFWNGKNTPDKQAFTSLVDSIKSNYDEECPCVISCETASIKDN
jgi:hypothetical protein